MKELNVRDRILETATRLFYTNGYNLTGINQIIDEAGIAKSSLYVHFRSKSDLLAACLDNQSLYFFTEMENYLKGIERKQEKLFGIFEFHINLYELTAFGGCPFLRIKAEMDCNEGDIWDRILQNKSGMKEIFDNCVADIDNRTGLTNEGLSDLLYYILEGATVTASIKKNADPIKSALNSVKILLKS